MIYIYALIDPDTAEIRYIGKTIRPKERLQNQCNEHSNTYRTHWIQDCLRRGNRPVQVILNTLFDNDNWQDVEKFWIAHGRKMGWPLTNCTDGGDGVVNLSGESKERMLKTWRGRKHKPETLEKISKTSKGRIPSPETLKKRSIALKGRVFSEEHKAKLRGKKTAEHARKIRNVQKLLCKSDVSGILLLLNDGWSVRNIEKLYEVEKTTIYKVKNGTYIPKDQS